MLERGSKSLAANTSTENMNKSQLQILLSHLDEVEEKKAELEQYQTPPSIAAEVLIQAHVASDLGGDNAESDPGSRNGQRCDVVDLGTGNGIFALGAAVLGATVRAYDTDPEALDVARENREWLEEELGRELDISFIEENVIFVDDEADTVVMNPPFGLQRGTGQANVRFLETAFDIAPVVYALLHQSEGDRERTRDFMRGLASRNSFKTRILAWFRFPLPNTFGFHEKEAEEINVDLYKFFQD